MTAGLTSAGYAADPGDLARPGYEQLADVHVVPLGDRHVHLVPGGWPDERPSQEWLAIEADPDAPLSHCDCWPSVRPVRHGYGLGRLLIHQARDDRTTGGNP